MFNKELLFQYLFLLIHSKFNTNFLIRKIKSIRFKIGYPTLFLKRNSIYFDIVWYKKRYDIPKDINPIIHYLKVGFKKGYNPHPNFDTNFYLNNYPDVKQKSINPLIHYLKYRNPSPIPLAVWFGVLNMTLTLKFSYTCL